MPPTSQQLTCLDHMNLTNKLQATLELHGKQIEEVARRMAKLEESNSNFARALGQMNGSIPRIETCIKEIFDRIRVGEIADVSLDGVKDEVKKQDGRLVAVETSLAVSKMRQNMIWGVIASLFVGTLVNIIKLFIV